MLPAALSTRAIHERKHACARLTVSGHVFEPQAFNAQPSLTLAPVRRHLSDDGRVHYQHARGADAGWGSAGACRRAVPRSTLCLMVAQGFQSAPPRHAPGTHTCLVSQRFLGTQIGHRRMHIDALVGCHVWFKSGFLHLAKWVWSQGSNLAVHLAVQPVEAVFARRGCLSLALSGWEISRLRGGGWRGIRGRQYSSHGSRLEVLLMCMWQLYLHLQLSSWFHLFASCK